jgi:hypothetical protein
VYRLEAGISRLASTMNVGMVSTANGVNTNIDQYSVQYDLFIPLAWRAKAIRETTKLFIQKDDLHESTFVQFVDSNSNSNIATFH